MCQLPGPVFVYDKEDCLDRQFLLLKNNISVWSVSCKTVNVALKLSKFSNTGINGKKGVPLYLPLLLMFYKKKIKYC